MIYNVQLSLAFPGDLSEVADLLDQRASRPELEAVANRRELFVQRAESERHIVATVCMTSWPDATLWPEVEQREPSLYLSLLTVHPKYAGQGVGGRILRHTLGHADMRALNYVRFGVPQQAFDLRKWCAQQGWAELRVAEPPERPAKALFQRRVADRPVFAHRGIVDNPGDHDAYG